MYTQITLPPSSQKEILTALAFEEFDCLGVKEAELGSDEIDDLLGNEAFLSGEIPSSLLEKLESASVDLPSSLFFADPDAERYGQYLAEQNLSYQSQKVEEIDWVQEWRKNFSQISIGKTFLVSPAEARGEFQNIPGREVVWIEPGQGFGTGGHETTCLCLEILENFDFNPPHVLDLGSGSGILAIGSQKKFPQSQVDLVEIDAGARENSLYNWSLNFPSGQPFYLYASVEALPRERKYQLIFANILLPQLKEFKTFLMSSLDAKGILVISGILKDQEHELAQFYAPELSLVTSYTKGDWSAQIYTYARPLKS